MSSIFTRKRIIANILTLFSGSTIAHILTGISLILTARQLGPASFGQYSATIVLATFTSIVFSLGLDVILLKNAGRTQSELGRQLGSVLVIKLTIGTIWFLVVWAAASFLDSGSFPESLLRQAALFVWVNNLFATLMVAFKASFKNQFTLIFTVSSELIWLIFTVILIGRSVTDVNAFMQIRIWSMFLSLGFAGLLIWRNFQPQAERMLIRELIKETPPYAASELLTLLFLRADVLIVSLTLTQIAVGLYSPAVSLINTLYILNSAIYGVMMPILSNQFSVNIDQAWTTAKRMIVLQATLGAGVFLMVLLSANLIVQLLGPRFSGSAEILRILSINILIHSVNFAFITIIIAVNRQSRATLIQAIVVSFNIIINLLVVQWGGIRGVAVVYVLTEFLLLLGYGCIVLRYRISTRIRNQMTNILLVNGHSFRNAGDAALMNEAANQLEGAFPSSQVINVLNDPQSAGEHSRSVGSLINWVRRNSDWNILRLLTVIPLTAIPALTTRFFGRPWLAFTPHSLRDLVRAYCYSDLVVSIPGGFVYSSGLGLSLILTLYTWAMAILAGKPIYILPQSIGPLYKKWERKCVGTMLNRCRLVMIREEETRDLLVRYGVRRQPILIPDLAFGFEGANPDDAKKWLQAIGVNPETDRPLLAITVINWGAQNEKFLGQEQYEIIIADTIRNFIKKYGGKVVFLPQCVGPTEGEDDRIPAGRIAHLLGNLKESVYSVSEQPPPPLLKSIIGQFDVLIGTRMHSNIFALGQEVPVLAIGYLHKTLGIARMIGIDEWVIDINQIADDNLLQKLEHLWLERYKVKELLSTTIPPLIEQSKLAGSMIYRDYQAIKRGKVNA